MKTDCAPANGPAIPLDWRSDITGECNCEFTPYYPDEGDEESWHYLRACRECGEWLWSLHCPHDGCQSKCGACGARMEQLP